MFEVITKKDYWGYLDRVAGRLRTSRLKDIQDAFVLDALGGLRGKAILEIGGGQSRVLPVLARHNRCWNLDGFEGKGAGPRRWKWNPRIRVVRDYMGAFNPAIPDGSLDVIFSISVIEHIETGAMEAVLRDCHRMLKPGGIMYHAVDVYLLDPGADHPHAEITRARIALYRSFPAMAGFTWLEPPATDDNVRASAAFADNSCDELYRWNRIVPQLESLRAIAMSFSLRMGLRKT